MGWHSLPTVAVAPRAALPIIYGILPRRGSPSESPTSCQPSCAASCFHFSKRLHVWCIQLLGKAPAGRQMVHRGERPGQTGAGLIATVCGRAVKNRVIVAWFGSFWIGVRPPAGAAVGAGCRMRRRAAISRRLPPCRRTASRRPIGLRRVIRSCAKVTNYLEEVEDCTWAVSIAAGLQRQ